MKILMVNDHIDFVGGAEAYLHNLSKALHSEGHQIVTLSTEPEKKENYPYIEKQRYSGEYPDQSLNYPLTRIWNTHAKKAMREAIDSENPDIVHFHNVFARLSPSVITEATPRKPTVITLHDSRFDCARFLYLDKKGDVCSHGFSSECLTSGCVNPGIFIFQRIRKALYSQALERVGAIIAINQFLEKRISKIIPDKKITKIPSFMDNPPGRHDPKKESIVLFAGRLEYYKGLKYLIEAMACVGKSSPLRLVVAGDGSEKEDMVKLAEDLGVDADFLGRISQDSLRELYRKAEVVCVPSLADNSPLVIYEAMAAADPVVASDVGGIGDLVDNEETGLLVKPKDPRSIAGAILRIHEDTPLQEKMRTNAKRKASEEFSKEKHLERLLKAYENAIASFAPNKGE